MIELATGSEIAVSEACKYLSDVGLCARDYIDRDLDDSLSGGELKSASLYTDADHFVKRLQVENDYIYDEKRRLYFLNKFQTLLFYL